MTIAISKKNKHKSQEIDKEIIHVADNVDNSINKNELLIPLHNRGRHKKGKQLRSGTFFKQKEKKY